MKILAVGLALLLVGGIGLAASWEAFGLQILTGTVLGYLGGFAGAQAGAYLAQAFGWGLIDGVLGPILAAYVGYAFGSTLGAWAGVTWTGFYLRIEGDLWFSLLGASAGTALAFLLASFTDWEWALRLGPPMASLGGALFFTIAPKAQPSPRSD